MPARQCTLGATIILQVPVESRLPAPSPVPVRVVVNSGPRVQKAEEYMPRRTDHNPRMSVPDDQIPRFGLRNALESFHTVEEIVGACIRIRKSRLLVDGVYKMRTITLAKSRSLRIERGCHHGQPFIVTQGAIVSSKRGRRTLGAFWRNRILCPRGANQPPDQHPNRRLSPIPHNPYSDADFASCGGYVCSPT